MAMILVMMMMRGPSGFRSPDHDDDISDGGDDVDDDADDYESDQDFEQTD